MTNLLLRILRLISYLEKKMKTLYSKLEEEDEDVAVTIASAKLRKLRREKEGTSIFIALIREKGGTFASVSG